MEGANVATIKDLARLTGLSVATISKYLNGGNVLEKNSLVIQQAIDATNYTLNEHARALKTNTSRTVGFVTPRFSDVYATQLASEAAAYLREYNYSLFVFESLNSLEGEIEALNFFASKNVDAVMAAFIGDDAHYYQQLLSKYKFPVVLFDKTFDSKVSDSVTINNLSAAHAAVNKLIEYGHREIAIVRGDAEHFTSHQRYLGYVQALEEHGIELREDYVIEVDYSGIDVFENITRLFANKRKPTAIFSVNYFTTVSTIMVLNQLDYSIPEEISLFGFDNYDLFKIVKPKPWLMVQPMKAIAQEGTRMLMDRIRNQSDQPYRSVVLESEMYVGGSIKHL